MAESQKQGKKGAKSSSPGRKRYFERRLLVKRAEVNKAKRIARHKKRCEKQALRHSPIPGVLFNKENTVNLAETPASGKSIKHPYLSRRVVLDANKRRVSPPICGGLVTATRTAPETRRITMRPVTNACADYVARNQPGGAIIHRMDGSVSHVYCRA